MADLTEVLKLRSHLSGAELKSLYEGEEDTNAFTNAEKAKVANTETSTQLNVRDEANRDRENHTGTQLASTISDFDTEVSSNTDVAANTSARHSAVTVTDSDTLDFALTGQDVTAIVKPASITTTQLSAGVNTSLGLADSAVQPAGLVPYAPRNNPTFTGTSLILPNNSRINGTEHFYQTTKPTVRGDSSALVVGDRWWKIDDGTEWFWNGTYWLGERTYALFFNAGSPIINSRSVGGNAVFAPFSIAVSAFIVRLAVWGFVPTTNDSNNRWEIRVGSTMPGAGSSPISVSFFDTQSWGVSSTSAYGLAGINEMFSVTSFPIQSVALGLTKVGSPGNITLSGASVMYRPVL